MEKLIINHQSRKGLNIIKMKEELWKNYTDKETISIHTLQLDHIIPYCISLDNSLSNLQLLKPKEHKEKSIKDRKIIKEFKEKGWIEKLTNYSHQLNKPMKFLIKEFKLVRLGRLDSESGVNLTYA